MGVSVVKGPNLVGSYNPGAANITTTGAQPFTVPGSFGTTIPVGAVIVATMTMNAGSGIGEGTFTDSKGNTYTLFRSVHNNTSGQLTRTAVWLCKVTTALTASDTWTHTAPAGDTARVRQCALVGFIGLDPTTPIFSSNDAAPTTVNSVAMSVDVPGVGSGRAAEMKTLVVAGLSSVVRVSPRGSIPGEQYAGTELYDQSSSVRTLAIEAQTIGVNDPDPATISASFAAAATGAVVGLLLQPATTPEAPTADAGPNHYVKPGRVELLDGSGSRNHPQYEGDALRGGPTRVTYAWTQIAGPAVVLTPSPAVSVSNAGIRAAAGSLASSTQKAGRFATYTVPAGAAPGTVLTFRLTVTNDVGLTSTDDVSHFVGPTKPRVTLQLGNLDQRVVDLDPDALAGGSSPTLQDPLLYLDGLTLGWRYMDPDEVVRQLEPMVAKIQLSTPDVANLDGLQDGLLASVLVQDEYGDHVASVHGRLGELTADQSRYVMADGSVQIRTTVAVEVVDHQATTNPVTDDVTRPLENWWLRWQALMDLFHADDPDILVDLPGGRAAIECNVDVLGNARAIDITAAPVLDLFRANLYEMPLSTGNNTEQSGTLISRMVGHYLLAPVVEGIGVGTQDLDHLSLHVVPSLNSTVAQLYFPLPNRVAPPVGHPHRIPASLVELGGSWRRVANKTANAVVVKQRNNADTKDTASALRLVRAGKGRITKRLDAQYACRIGADRIDNANTEGPPIARVHLPEQAAAGNGWDRDGFVYHPPTFEALTGGSGYGGNPSWSRRDPSALLVTTYGPLGGCWFPDWRRPVDPFKTADPDESGPGGSAIRRWGPPQQVRLELAPECFLRPVLITGLAPTGSLARSDNTYVGHLVSATLTIRDAKPTVSFELARTAATDGAAPPAPTTDPNGPYF